MYQLYNGDCLEIMPTLPAQSVDAIITDLPYGSTACDWDSIIPFEEMWKAVKHVLKPNGAFVTTASQPFTSLLVSSNIAWFRYEWIWDKDCGSGFLNASKRPLKQTEDIIVFSRANLGGFTFNPIFSVRQKDRIRPKRTPKPINKGTYGNSNGLENDNPEGKKHPTTLLTFPARNRECNVLHREHPTQKPVALYAYLIRTYTNPGDVVLDMCFGSNTTGVACVETGRNYIGIEKDMKYFELGQRRIEQAQPPLFVETGTPANNVLQPTPKGAEQKEMFN